ncbi:hypothetical protein BDB01DRAFT_798762 [Pilobolus umbonatus]|nr:hypothetical protein BDB01DRAFT_798762 [Pilobolus umbonatus]
MLKWLHPKRKKVLFPLNDMQRSCYFIIHQTSFFCIAFYYLFKILLSIAILRFL